MKRKRRQGKAGLVEPDEVPEQDNGQDRETLTAAVEEAPRERHTHRNGENSGEAPPEGQELSLKDLQLAADVQEDHVPGQSKLLARLQALRYSGLLGREGDRAQVAMARRLLREGLAQCIHVPLQLALDETVDPDVRLRAVGLLAQHGLGSLTEKSGHLAFGGGEKGVALLPDFASIEQVAKAALERKLAEEQARGEQLADDREIIQESA